jgi:hypothetical protein
MQNSPRKETASPKRSRGSLERSVDFDLENKRLRVEVEHLKNTLIGLNEKLTVFNDLKKDLEQAKHMLHSSEVDRNHLQEHIEGTAKLSRQQAQENRVY